MRTKTREGRDKLLIRLTPIKGEKEWARVEMLNGRAELVPSFEDLFATTLVAAGWYWLTMVVLP